MKLDVNTTEIPDVTIVLDREVSANSLIRIRADGTQMLNGMRIEKVVAGGTALPEEHRYSREEMEKNWSWHIRTKSMIIVRATSDLAPESSLVVSSELSSRRKTYTTDQPNPIQFSGLSWTLNIGTVESLQDEALSDIAEAFRIDFVPGAPDHIEAYLKPDGTAHIQHFDARSNPTLDYRGSFTLSCNGSPKAAEGGDGPTRVKLDGSPQAGQRYDVSDDAGRKTVSNAAPFAIDGTSIYFGEFHWHTDFSGDGQRATTDAMTSARDELGLDFAGPADHMNQTGGYGQRTPTEQRDLVMPFDDPGTFCTIPTSELSRRYGHTNLIADSFETFIQITSRFKNELEPAWAREPNRYPFQPLIDLCPPGKALVVPHHSNMDSYVREHVVREDGRPFWCAMHFPMPADRSVVRLFEVVQGRGAFETELTDPDWRIYDGGLGGSAQTALMRGYRMGFVAGTDNHCGWPTRKGGGYAGITAVQSDRLDTKSIFNAMYERRCYASSGARIVADATLNDRPLGSELRLEPGEKRRFTIRINGTAPLEQVQVVHSGYILKDFELEKTQVDFEAEWCDERPGRPLEDAYYYVRARQDDGHCVWLSPFWVDLAAI